MNTDVIILNVNRIIIVWVITLLDFIYTLKLWVQHNLILILIIHQQVVVQIINRLFCFKTEYD